MKQIKLMERIDQLTRLEATGTPVELALRLGISKTKLYRIINVMKDLDAPLEYDINLQSYIYAKDVGFKFGFFTDNTTSDTLHPHAG